MTKPKTLDQLRAEKERAETQLAQEKHKLERLENRKKYLEKGERTKRTHRLCNLGGTIESLAPEVKDLTRTEMTELMEHIFSLSEVQRAVRHMAITHIGQANREKELKLEKHIYSAKSAQKNYETTRSESRQGIAITPEELKRVDAIVSPLVKLGQSIHMICVNNADDIMLDEKTIYNYIDAGLLSVDNVDLPRKVRYRTRSHKKPVRVDKQCHVGRTYEDFEAYLAANPDIPVVEMDSVEGRKGGKVLLTIYFRNSSLMLAFIRDNNTAKSVTEIFDWLYEQLGHEVFTSLFQVILTDRGSEFTNPLAIEFNKGNGRRTHIFYCDPQRSDQKGGCEVTHEMIRRVLPKKTSFDNLTQDDINLMMSHINSYNRKKLNNQSAHQLFSFINGGDILDKLGIKSIPANEINLTPLLLKK